MNLLYLIICILTPIVAIMCSVIIKIIGIMPMDYHTIGISLKTLGEVILAITIITVHYKIKKEKKIDRFVIKEITHEEILGVLSISLIIVGYLFELSSVTA